MYMLRYSGNKGQRGGGGYCIFAIGHHEVQMNLPPGPCMSTSTEDE